MAFRRDGNMGNDLFDQRLSGRLIRERLFRRPTTVCVCSSGRVFFPPPLVCALVCSSCAATVMSEAKFAFRSERESPTHDVVVDCSGELEKLAM